MTKIEIIEALKKSPKGTFATLEIVRPVKLLKSAEAQGIKIEKKSIVQVRLANYSAMRAVREAEKNEEREAPRLPSHISHVETVEGVKFWHGKNGQLYLPYPVDGNQPISEYFADGVKVESSTVKPYALASEFPERGTLKEEKAESAKKFQAPFIAVKLENIAAIR